jgi:cyclophilin family peptidyl-prolyl cis-trans isomerase
MIRKTLTVFVVLLVLANISCQERYPDLDDGLYAEIITSKGTMVAKLHYDKVPVTVANFVALAEGNHPLAEEQYQGKPFYDSIIFHRVMDNFMIQGGDPQGMGSGTPGYQFAADYSPELKHDKPGILSMANAGGIKTNGSQFFYNRKTLPTR